MNQNNSSTSSTNCRRLKLRWIRGSFSRQLRIPEIKVSWRISSTHGRRS
jgi:hypothetical protein